jgi:transposase InsO family protein
MCKLLKIPRSNYYYEINKTSKPQKYGFDKEIIKIFKESKYHYGTRKIKKELYKLGIIISRRLIGRVMKRNGLVSTYTIKQYKVHKNEVNKSNIGNELDRNFDNDILHDVIVSDLTYVNVSGKWHYLCLLIDIFNREIIGYSIGAKKTAELVIEAFMSSSVNLTNIRLFHTDRGKEFDNKFIDKLLQIYNINRSLSNPGTPYDNAVAEATYKIFKTEFLNKRFYSIEQLKMETFEYVNWYNNKRIHGSLNYMTPVEYRLNTLYSNIV